MSQTKTLRVVLPVYKNGNWEVFDENNDTIDHVGTDHLHWATMKNAFKNRNALKEVRGPNKVQWKQTPLRNFEGDFNLIDFPKEYARDINLEKLRDRHRSNKYGQSEQSEDDVETQTEKKELSSDVQRIHNSYDQKPDDFLVDELKWKVVTRNVVRGKNTLITGPTGTGKTTLSQIISDVMDRNFYKFNLGATQDAREYLIGNMQLDTEKGTWFNKSEFVKAIEDPDAVILLDEIARASMDAWNILMSVLDPSQRYLRIQEEKDSPTIDVADSATFIATANIGSEYTSSFTIDRALLDRFITIEMEYLDRRGIKELYKRKFGYNKLSKGDVQDIADMVTQIHEKYKQEELSNMVSTRHLVEIGHFLTDGFTLGEAFQIIVYPLFSDDMQTDSERTFVKQIAQSKLG